MYTLARKVTEWLIVNEAISIEDKELYEYAMYTVFITVAPLILSVFIGVMLGACWESVVLILPFMFIRKFSGGYHAKSAGVCMLSSCSLLVLCIYLALHLEYHLYMSILMGIAVLSLSINSPIDSENRRLDLGQIKQYRNITIIISVICLLVHVLLILCDAKIYGVCVAIGLLLSAGLQLPCVIQKMCKKKQSNA